MRKPILLFAFTLALTTPALAQISNPVGPGPSPGVTPPCTAFGTTTGTCLQGAGALGTPSSGTATNLTGTATALNIGGNAALDLPLTGGTMSGNIALGTFGVTGNASTNSMGTLAIGMIGSPITSSGPGGALTSNAFDSTAYAPLASPALTGSGSITANTNTDNLVFVTRNQNAGSGASTNLLLENDAGSVPHSVLFVYTSQAYAGSSLTSMPTGETGGLATIGAYPFGIGTGGTARIIISGSGPVTVNQPILNTGITSDSGHTDATVCEDTTSHQFYAGSGTLGVCSGTSSRRFKTNIVDAVDGLGAIMQLHPKNFRYLPGYGDNGAREQYGFIAEDVVKKLPLLVQLDSKKRPNSVDILGMVPVVVKSIQEMQGEIKNLGGEAIDRLREEVNLLIVWNCLLTICLGYVLLKQVRPR